MTLKTMFDDFSVSPADTKTAPLSDAGSEALEAIRSEGFEAGYASGWDDALRAAEDRRGAVSAEFERTIQDLGFTYHEALDQLRGQFLNAIDGFLEALFPGAVPDLIMEHIHTALADVGASDAPAEASLAISGGQRALFEALLPRNPPIQISLVEEESLRADQAFLRIGGQEQMIDFEPLVAGFRDQLAAIRAMRETEMKDVG